MRDEIGITLRDSLLTTSKWFEGLGKKKGFIPFILKILHDYILLLYQNSLGTSF